MNQTITNWRDWLMLILKEFMVETAKKPTYEVVDINICPNTGLTKAIIKLSERHVIEKNISEIVVDNQFIEGLDKKTIRTLTFMATAEHLKPDYSITVHHMTSEVDEYLLEIKSTKEQEIIKKTPTELSKDKELIARFNPIEANRIGYMAGVRETTKEYQSLKRKLQVQS